MSHTPDYVTASILYLADGNMAARELHRGTEEECLVVYRELCVVAWSGPDNVINAELVVMPATEFDEMMENDDD